MSIISDLMDTTLSESPEKKHGSRAGRPNYPRELRDRLAAAACEPSSQTSSANSPNCCAINNYNVYSPTRSENTVWRSVFYRSSPFRRLFGSTARIRTVVPPAQAVPRRKPASGQGSWGSGSGGKAGRWPQYLVLMFCCSAQSKPRVSC